MLALPKSPCLTRGRPQDDESSVRRPVPERFCRSCPSARVPSGRGAQWSSRPPLAAVVVLLAHMLSAAGLARDDPTAGLQNCASRDRASATADHRSPRFATAWVSCAVKMCVLKSFFAPARRRPAARVTVHETLLWFPMDDRGAAVARQAQSAGNASTASATASVYCCRRGLGSRCRGSVFSCRSACARGASRRADVLVK